VQKDFQQGQKMGVNGTPTFLINDQVLVGLQPIGVFEKAIEDARREAEGG
jgi:protein-disulfide isomerase